MKEAQDAFTLKLNPIKESIIKQKKEKENLKYSKKKPEQKLIKDLIGIYPIKGANFVKNEIRNTTAPNKNRSQIKKNFQHLKITAKNKNMKELIYTNILNNNRINNYNEIIRPRKILGKSLPKNSLKNNKMFNINQENDNQNLSSNDTKNILSNNNIIVLKKEMNNCNNKNKSNGFNRNIYSYNKFNPILENVKANDDYKIINQNLRKKNRKTFELDYNHMNKIKINRNNNNDMNVINKKIIQNNININLNKKLKSNNSFNNNSTNIAFNNFQNNFNSNNINYIDINEKLTNPKNVKRINNFQNILGNHTLINNKRSMSSSITIPRNQLKQINSQIIMNGFGMYIENDLMRSVNNNNTLINKAKNKPKKQEPPKKNNIYQFLILKGNASYLIRNCMKHRINWTEVENIPENANIFNFKWKELSIGIDYNSLNRNPGMKQIVNHYENHYAISNKANMFINIMKYCEQRKISVFKYLPFTIVFKIKDRKKIKNNEKQKRWTEKLEKLKDFIQNISTNIKDYNNIGDYYYNEEYIKDKEKRNEFERIEQIKMNKRKREKEIEESKLKELKDNDKIKEILKRQKSLKEKENYKEAKYNGKFKVYSDIFPRLKITDKLPTRYKTIEEKEKDKKNDILIGNNTLIEIPQTHFQGKNMWVLKAVNLNRGMCIKVVNSFEQMEKVINKFKKGVDYRFTAEEIEEEQNGIECMPLSDDETKMQKTAIKIEIFDEKVKKSGDKTEKNKTEENLSDNKKNNFCEMNKNKKEEDKEEKIYKIIKKIIFVK